MSVFGFNLGARSGVEGREDEEGGTGAGKFKSQTGYHTLPANVSVFGLDRILLGNLRPALLSVFS